MNEKEETQHSRVHMKHLLMKENKWKWITNPRDWRLFFSNRGPFASFLVEKTNWENKLLWPMKVKILHFIDPKISKWKKYYICPMGGKMWLVYASTQNCLYVMAKSTFNSCSGLFYTDLELVCSLLVCECWCWSESRHAGRVASIYERRQRKILLWKSLHILSNFRAPVVPELFRSLIAFGWNWERWWRPEWGLALFWRWWQGPWVRIRCGWIGKWKWRCRK